MDTLTKAQWKNHVENQKGSGIGGRKTRLFAKASSKGQVTIPKAVERSSASPRVTPSCFCSETNRKTKGR